MFMANGFSKSAPNHFQCCLFREVNFALWPSAAFIRTSLLFPYVRVAIWMHVRAHHLLCLWGPGIEMKTVEMISRAQTSNARGRLSYDASIDCKNKGGAMVRRMETVVERDRWSRQKTSCLGSAASAASRSAALGFMSVRICRKSCSPGTKCGEWMGERCKGMCGALRVWMIGEVNQVPSEPSCHSFTFPILLCFQHKHVSSYLGCCFCC